MQRWKYVELKEKELAIKREEFRGKELELQLKLKEMEAKAVEHLPAAKRKDVLFDVSRQVRLMPPFQEQEVENFFLHFEKVAANFHWPMEARPMLLQSVLVGKAHKVYSSLSMEQSTDYDLVKRDP